MTTNNKLEKREVGTRGPGISARCLGFCKAAADKVRRFERQWAKKLAAEIQNGVPQQLLQQVMNEAEALAWDTRYPHLFLPDLAEEKIQGAREWASRQQQILKT